MRVVQRGGSVEWGEWKLGNNFMVKEQGGITQNDKPLLISRNGLLAIWCEPPLECN